MRALTAFACWIIVLSAPLESRCQAEEPLGLEGAWIVTSAMWDGEPTDAMNFEGMRWTFAKDSLQIGPGKNTPAGLAGKPDLKCTYTVDNGQTPAHFDWTLHSGEKKFIIPAIYEHKGDLFRIAFAPRSQPRPTSFDTSDGKWVVYELKRLADEKKTD
jgi:uncharacterized protein (TIGR03067 family)